MLYFNDINLRINNNPFLINTLALTVQDQSVRFKGIGESFNDNSYVNGIPEGSIQASYSPVIAVDPFINYPNNYSGQLNSYLCDGHFINLSNLSGNFLVQNYSLEVNSNSTASSSVELRSYLPVSGDISADSQSLSYISSIDEIPSFWTSRFEGGLSPDTTINVLAVQYQYNINYLPSYRMGNSQPVNIQVDKITETCSIECEYSSNIPLTKTYLTGILGKTELVVYGGTVEDLNIFNQKRIDLSSFTLSEASTNINTSDRIVVNMTFTKEI